MSELNYGCSSRRVLKTLKTYRQQKEMIKSGNRSNFHNLYKQDCENIYRKISSILFEGDENRDLTQICNYVETYGLVKLNDLTKSNLFKITTKYGKKNQFNSKNCKTVRMVENTRNVLVKTITRADVTNFRIFLHILKNNI